MSRLGGDPSPQIAKVSHSDHSIVFGMFWRSRQGRLVRQLNRPGGNATGVTIFGRRRSPSGCSCCMTSCRRTLSTAFLMNPNTPNGSIDWEPYRQQLPLSEDNFLSLIASSESELDVGFARMVQQ